MSNRKTNKTKKWQKVVTVFALLAVGALVAVGIIHTKKHWNEISKRRIYTIDIRPSCRKM